MKLWSVNGAGKKRFIAFLVLEMLFAAVFGFVARHFWALDISVLSFPIKAIAEGLKALSALGKIGNGLAVALWIGISLFPAVIALSYKQKKGTLFERLALLALSLMLAFAIYGTANSGLFLPELAGSNSNLVKFIKANFAFAVLSFVVLVAVLRLIRLFSSADKKALFGFMRLLLLSVCLSLTPIIGYLLISGFMEAFIQNKGMADIFVQLFNSLLKGAALMLILWVLIRGLELIELADTKNQEGIAASAKHLSRSCCISLGFTALASALGNAVRLVLMPWLSNIYTNVEIPAVGIIALLIVLLFSRLLLENKRLREDNDLFI